VDILEAADELLTAKPLVTSTPHDPSFISSFWIYPEGLAYAYVYLLHPQSYLTPLSSMKGFYHAQMARLSKSNVDTAKDHYSKAASFYLKAGTTYPDDDEQAACTFLTTQSHSDIDCGCQGT
jgi:hypothetical protein